MKETHPRLGVPGLMVSFSRDVCLVGNIPAGLPSDHRNAHRAGQEPACQTTAALRLLQERVSQLCFQLSGAC